MHIVDLFDRGARSFPNRLAFSGAGGGFTFAEAQSLSCRVAKALLENDLGVGTRFAALSPNCGQAMIVMLGGARAGGVWCNLNLRERYWQGHGRRVG
jgi:acyl-CoA synthetase (AMP-forming)/AMP-acid ligase II